MASVHLSIITFEARTQRVETGYLEEQERRKIPPEVKGAGRRAIIAAYWRRQT
jgi:hypothetical protein